MARRSRSRDLAGLAALGALAYNFLGPGSRRKDGTLAPVSDATPVPVDQSLRGSQAAGVSGPAGMSAAERSGLDISEGERIAMDAADRAALRGYDDMYANRAARAAVSPGQAISAAAAQPMSALRAYDDMYSNRPAAAPVIGPRSTGRGGATAAEMAEYQRQLEQDRMRGRGAGRTYDTAPQSRAQRQATREEMISQIPTGGTRTVEGGDRVSGNEFTRNVGNIATGLGPGTLAGLGKVGAEMATARGAAQRAAEARAAARAAEGREAVTNPMSWTAGPGGMKKMQAAEDAERKARRAMEARRDAQMAVKGEESDVTGGAIGYKKGGSAKAKPKKMASGGMTSKVSSASKRADGIATKGKTKCKIY